MPLTQQDNSKGGGGSRENRRSMVEYLGLNVPVEPLAAPGASSSHDEEWHWQPRSPEAAQTPRSLVPPKCFPPRYTASYGSYSERARPGSWVEPSGEHTIMDLVASLKSLEMPPANNVDFSTARTGEVQIETQWWQACEQAAQSPQDKEVITRRASFCGTVKQAVKPAVWDGPLPARSTEGSYSAKVFLGGLPWDISEQSLMHALKTFHPVRVEWPGRGSAGGGTEGPRGFAYVTFESEARVHSLLSSSRYNGSSWFYRISSRNFKSKEAEVIPWSTADNSCVWGGSARLEPARTVFVGALHGMLSAHALATIMNDLFSGVVYAGLDTDKTKYPIGSGRVTFNNVHSYVRAVSAGYIEIRTDKFTKKVQVDPYIEEAMCSRCNLQQGPYFCRDPVCFRYFCRTCWAWQHFPDSTHRPLVRSFKNSQPLSLNWNGNATFTYGSGNVNNNGNVSMCNNAVTRQSPQSELSNGSAFVGANGSTPSPPATSAASGSSEHAAEETSEW